LQLTKNKNHNKWNFNKSDRPSPPTNPIAYFPNQAAIAPSSPTKPDRLFPKIKQRSPLHHPQNPIAYSSKSNSDRLK